MSPGHSYTRRTPNGIYLAGRHDGYGDHHELFRLFGIRFLAEAGLSLHHHRPDTYDLIGAFFYEGKRPCLRVTVMFQTTRPLTHPYKPLFPSRRDGRVSVLYEAVLRVCDHDAATRAAKARGALLTCTDRTRCLGKGVLEQHVAALHATVRIDAFESHARTTGALDRLLRPHMP